MGKEADNDSRSNWDPSKSIGKCWRSENIYNTDSFSLNVLFSFKTITSLKPTIYAKKLWLW